MDLVTNSKLSERSRTGFFDRLLKPGKGGISINGSKRTSVASSKVLLRNLMTSKNSASTSYIKNNSSGLGANKSALRPRLVTKLENLEVSPKVIESMKSSLPNTMKAYNIFYRNRMFKKKKNKT